jgi:hypothetical protein
MESKKLKLQLTNRAAIFLSTALLLVQPLATSVHAQPDPEVAIDRAFRYESSSSQGSMIGSLKQWMGAYQRIAKNGDTYSAIFDSGSIPVNAQFKTNGSIESMSFGCPRSNSLSVSDAPEGIRKALSKCAGFKS